MLSPLLLSAALLCAAPASAPAAGELERETNEWHARRKARLTAEDGWLSLVGLHWLDEGETAAGASPDAGVQLPPSTPAELGVFTRKGKAVRFSPAPGARVQVNGKPFPGGPLQDDTTGRPDVLQVGTVRINVLVRGERVGLRIKDSEAPTRKAFSDVPRFPVRAAWRVEARFEPAQKGRELSVPNVLGTVEQLPAAGVAIFTVGGKEYRLTPVQEPGESSLFFIFGDASNRTDTYGAGRFLYTELPKDGRLTLDFNRAYNPPCAFTRFATCPLPPRENKLPLRIDAGEKRHEAH